MPQFVVHGGKRLHGTVVISGSKNAALPILAATLLTDKKCIIKNVPDIEDIHTMLGMLGQLGSAVEFKNHTITIQTRKIHSGAISPMMRLLGCKMRASVVLLGPLLARTGRAHLPYPGGCVLGARPVDTHTDVLRQLGARMMKSRQDEILFEGSVRASEVVLPEFSVTATENVIMAAALTPAQTIIRIAAIEPHVQDLCSFLQKMGVEISSIGSHTLVIRGKKHLRGAAHSITPDYLEAGTFVLAALVTRGSVTVKNIIPHDLDAFWNLLREMKVPFTLGRTSVTLRPAHSFQACKRLQTNVFPGFPTDLQPPFVILLTQARGESRVHETLFESRFKYFPDLLKMGAKIIALNPHEAVIKGPVKLCGSAVRSWDIRAGAAMIVAALAAKGKTVVNDIQYIDRGYEKFDEKLRKLGAEIQRI